MSETPETITIMDNRTGARTSAVPVIWQHGPFAIHRTHGLAANETDSYTLTHVPTGYAINTDPLDSIEAAAILARHCLDLPIPWESSNPIALYDAVKATGKTLRELFTPGDDA